MVRKEEIEATSKLVYKTKMGRRLCFIRGAEWADRSMIKKACQYLYEWNRQQAEKHGIKAILSPVDYTIDVHQFEQTMKKLNNE